MIMNATIWSNWMESTTFSKQSTILQYTLKYREKTY